MVDVREPEEFATGASADAKLHPVAEFLNGSVIKNLSRDKDLVLYCRSGKRSATCLSVLKDAGFQRATHLEGGILAWQSFNQDTEKGINGK